MLIDDEMDMDGFWRLVEKRKYEGRFSSHLTILVNQPYTHWWLWKSTRNTKITQWFFNGSGQDYFAAIAPGNISCVHIPTLGIMNRVIPTLCRGNIITERWDPSRIMQR